MTADRTTIDPDALTMDAIRAGVLAGRPVTVLGLARSGIGLARFFRDAGAAVTIYDVRPPDELAEALAEVGPSGTGGVRLLAGPDADPGAALSGAHIVATSPSINPDYPTTEPRLRAALLALVDARAAGEPGAPALVSEADLFLRLCPAPTIGVTGTKGKTTTSSLIAALLAEDATHPVELGGNIGRPLVDVLPSLTPEHRVVVELSELQLPTLSRGTDVAVYTNVTADHLDRHGSLDAYRAAKRRLAELTRVRGGLLVLNDEDPFVAGLERDYDRPTSGGWPGRTITRYRTARAAADGVGVVDGRIVAARIGEVMPAGELQLPGAHNVANALAAISVALHFGIPPAAIRRAAGAFRGVEHRLEPVAEVAGVRFVNDSQGTQPDAVAAALRAFPPPVVLIAGGRDKGVDLSDLGPVVADRAVAAVLIGESGPTLERLFRASGLTETSQASSLEEAVRRADDLARAALASRAPGTIATVLLSPAAASFDMFEDYAARGRAFKAAVAGLAAESAAHSAAELEAGR
jgi:UDP-N-acetylmuramoylalanine--D-glutamate ligase